VKGAIKNVIFTWEVPMTTLHGVHQLNSSLRRNVLLLLLTTFLKICVVICVMYICMWVSQL